MKVFRAASFASALLLAAGPAHAAWQFFDFQSGLGMDDVTHVTQDSSGLMWFTSHLTGVVTSYDGLRWSRNDLGAFILDLVPDRQGHVLVLGSFPGFPFYVRFLAADDWRLDPVGVDLFSPVAIAERPDSDIWIASTQGLFSVRDYKGIPLPAGNAVTAMTSGRDDDLWVGLEQRPNFFTSGTGVGAAVYRHGTWIRYTSADGLASDTVRTIFVDRSGGIWFGTDGGITYFDGNSTWKRYTTADGLPENAVTRIVEDGSGEFWCLSFPQGRTSRFDGVRWRTYTEADGFPPMYYLRELGADREGNLWVPNGTSGVSRFDRAGVRVPAISAGRARFEDARGSIWFDDSPSGSVRFDQNQAFHYSESEPAGSASGVVWAGGCSGVRRFVNGKWETEPLSASVVTGCVSAPFEDKHGVLWFVGADSTSFWSFDGAVWRAHSAPPSLPYHPRFGPVLAKSDGTLWYATNDSGLVRYDPRLDLWTRFEPDKDGLPHLSVYKLLEDRVGNLWAQGYAEVSRFDGNAWTRFFLGTINGLAEDGAGRLWAIVDQWMHWFDGTQWRPYFSTRPNFPQTIFPELGVDREGEVWLTAGVDPTGRHPVVRLRGEDWDFETFLPAPPLFYMPMFVDHAGTIWPSGRGGVVAYERDRTAPQTVIVSRPKSLTSERRVAFSFLPGYTESELIEFRTAMDGRDTSAWSSRTSAEFTLEDSTHTFEVWARDRFGNADPTSASATFEIDATPPAPILSSPTFGAVVRDSVIVFGEARDRRFRDWRLEIRSADSTAWSSLASSGQAAPPGSELARFDSHPFAEGEHLLRLSVADTLGLTGTAQISIVIDNLPPRADQSSPAVVRRALGGDVYTTDGRIHLYFPPNALSNDDTIHIETRAPAPPPAPGLASLGARLDLRWGSGALDKPAVLTLLSLPDSVIHGSPALWDSVDAKGWQPAGGTLDAASRRFSAPISIDGGYALFGGPSAVTTGVTLSPLSLVPRVFSPIGSFANRDVAIAFTLGRAGPVTVRIFNRAGRLVREVGAGILLPAGVNLLRWDGRDRTGATVEDGLYLVTVEALGETQQSTLAVVR